MQHVPSPAKSLKTEDPVALLHEAVCDAKNSNRYLWLRDHCTYEDTLELIELVRQNKHVLDRAEIIDAAVDAKITAALMARAQKT
jgi:hypothetical protein